MRQKTIKMIVFTILICAMSSSVLATASQGKTPVQPGQSRLGTPKPAPAPRPTATPNETTPPRPTVTPTQTPLPTPPAPPAQTATPRPSPTPMPSPVQTTTPRPSPTPMPSPVQTTTPRPTPSPTATPTPTPMPSPVQTATPRPTATPAPNNSIRPQPFVLDNFKVIERTLKCFGVDSTELANYIKEGKKLEDVLRAERISTKKFKRQVLKEYYKAVEEGVANKQLTEEQAKQLKMAIKETVKGWLPRK